MRQDHKMGFKLQYFCTFFIHAYIQIGVYVYVIKHWTPEFKKLVEEKGGLGDQYNI